MRLMTSKTEYLRPPLERVQATIGAFFLSEWEEAALRVALGDAAPKERRFASDVVMTTMSVVAKKVSEQARSRAEVEAWSRAVGEMFCAYLSRLMGGI